MTLHKQLLEQASHLMRREPRRPRQASLRRAVSVAYYGLFHLLARETSRVLVRGGGQDGLRAIVSRTLVHHDMQEAAKHFATGAVNKSPWTDLVQSVPRDLQTVAEAFVELQQARHLADYDPSARFTRTQVEAYVLQAEDAFDAWQSIKGTPEAIVFLYSLMFWRRAKAK